MASSTPAAAPMLMMLVYSVKGNVKVETSDWLEEQINMKAELRSALIVCGVLSVMISGELLMLLWLADNLATLSTVRTSSS